MLIPPSSSWRGTVGDSYTPDDFAKYVQMLTLGFHPEFVVLHNTSAPTTKQWQSTPIVQRLRNLTSYYSGMGWKAGPHLFIDDNFIWLFTPLASQGTHSPSWNTTSWGIEMVGDYDVEPFDSGYGAKVQANAVSALATLLKKLGLQVTPTTLRFHYEDPKTTHACPGKLVRKDVILAKVGAAMIGAPEVATTVPPVILAPITPTTKRFQVLTTEFGSVNDPQNSAYGGKVDGNALEVSLPCKVYENHRAVTVYYKGKRVLTRVNDVGPWNMHDAYWDGSGHPKAETQKALHQVAEDGLIPSNAAGLDCTPAVLDALGVPGAHGTRQATVEWEFTNMQDGDHPIPTPAPAPSAPVVAAVLWWEALLRALFSRA